MCKKWPRVVVSARRASLDYNNDVRPAIGRLVEETFEQRRSLPINYFPVDASAVEDLPRLMLVVLDPQTEWNDETRMRLAAWTR